MGLKDSRLYLIHIRECCERILDYTAGIEETWPSVPVVYDAVCRNLEIMGEAARQLDADFRAAHPEIPWREMGDVRNILIHGYYRVSGEILREIVREEIQPLVECVRKILESKQD
ncbi:MAG: DUF86 domain-containing protein [Bryobacterales bacterium]|nr:DUF86 domain-containing protein [Bryobacterales bacterium]